MNNIGETLIKKYFQERSMVSSDIQSFDNFVEKELQNIIDENKIVEPTIIPANVDEFKIRLDKIWVDKPVIIEADGSTKDLYPIEARLRKLTYAAPIYLEVSAHINGVQREVFTTQIGNLPVMLHSKFCNLHGKSREELIKIGEDPDDTGGYFVINGTEKVLIAVEDLAANTLLIEKASSGVSEYVGRIFSENGSYKIPHTFEKKKDGIFYLSFTRVKRIPIVVVLKALGMLKDQDIMQAISDQPLQEMLVNLYEFTDIKEQDDAMDYIAKKIGITQPREYRIERMQDLLDKYLMPHVGMTDQEREFKAKNICKLLKQFIDVSSGRLPADDKDHYMNKRLKLSGELLADLFRVNIKILIGDMLYNFQRIVKRGKFPSIKVIIREKLLTQRIYSAMATGNWSGSRKGISQRIDRHNFLASASHLQRVVSPLSTAQENFDARALHPTHFGRLCPSETPEGTNIGLRKNLSLFATISEHEEEDEILKNIKQMGVKTIR